MKTMAILFSSLLLLSLPTFASLTTTTGPQMTLGNGWASTYVSIEGAEVKQLGVLFSGKALDGLPDQDVTLMLEMPANTYAPPYNHVMLNWNAHGHEPTEIYGVPHFDFHFYLMSEEEQHGILCDGTDNDVCMAKPDPDYIPPFYIPTPAGVPMMGWHWVDPRSPEFNGKPFTVTFIYGFYNGIMSFVEPMITLAYLKTYPMFNAEVPVPKATAKPGYYPAAYSVCYDSVADQYQVTLRDLKWVNGKEKAIH